MSEDEGDRPRPSGIRQYFKPINVDQAREQHDRIAEKQAIKSAVQSAEDDALDSRGFGAREGLDGTIYAKQGVSDAFYALVWYRRASRGLIVTFD